MRNLSKVVCVVLVALFAQSVYSQGGVSINNTGAAPDGSSMLDIESTEKGLLIPRLQLTDINDAITVTAAANSLLVFNLAPSGVTPNDVEEGFYYWDASIAQWVKLVSGMVVGTDDQQIDSLVLVGNTLTAYVEDGGSASVDLSALSDADSDPTNEYNTAANLIGWDLNIIDDGGTQTVDLSGLLDSAYRYDEWKDSDTLGGGFPRDFVYAAQAKGFGNDVVVSDSGYVGVGTTNPTYGFHLAANGNVVSTGNHIAVTDVIVPNSRMSMGDGVSNPNVFSPLFLTQPAGTSNTGAFMTTQIQQGDDLGVFPTTVYNARTVNPLGPITTRPLFQWRNHTNIEMTMIANGYVGFATAIPDQRVDVFGNIQVRALDTIFPGSQRIFQYPDAGGNALGIHSLENISILTDYDSNGNDASTYFLDQTPTIIDTIMTIYGDNLGGRVGVGTATPQSQFHILSPTNNNVIRFETQNAGSQTIAMYPTVGSITNQVIKMTRQAGDDLFIETHFTAYNFRGTAAKSIRLATNNRTEDIIIVPNGDVGIGTPNPITRLNVQGGTARVGDATSFSELSYDGFNGTHSGLEIRNNIAGGSGGLWIDNTFKMHLGQPNMSNPVTVDLATGNVGVGTTTPQERLDIHTGSLRMKNPGTVSYNLNVQNNVIGGTNYAGPTFKAVGTNETLLILAGVGGTTVSARLMIDNDHGANTAPMYGFKNDVNTGISGGPGDADFLKFITNGNEAVRIDPIGNVGIGTTTPTQLLTVDNGTSVGTYTTTGWVHTSDARLKTNVVPLSSSLDKVLQIQGINFDWKDAPKENRQIGFLAQDLQKILPEAVVVDSQGRYGVAYGNLTPLLIEAVKEQQTIIAAQQKEIENLKLNNEAKVTSQVQTNENLQAQIDELKQILLQTSSK